MSLRRYRDSALLKLNIKAHLERAFINDAGLYFNVASGQYSVNGERQDVLKRVNGVNYESFTNNWAYETDASGVSTFPVTFASGVTIDGVFHSKGSSPHKPVVDYNNGRILFNGTEVSSSSTVETTFSYKHVSVAFPESNIVNQIFSQVKDNVVHSTHIYPSGNQRQMPVVIVDLQERESRPLELGGGVIKEQRVVLHVLANNEDDRDILCDLLEEQDRKVVQGVDWNKAPQLLTYQGDYASTYQNYNTLQASGAVQWRKMYISEARIVEKDEFHGWHRGRCDWQITTYNPRT